MLTHLSPFLLEFILPQFHHICRPFEVADWTTDELTNADGIPYTIWINEQGMVVYRSWIHKEESKNPIKELTSIFKPVAIHSETSFYPAHDPKQEMYSYQSRVFCEDGKQWRIVWSNRSGAPIPVIWEVWKLKHAGAKYRNIPTAAQLLG